MLIIYFKRNHGCVIQKIPFVSVFCSYSSYQLFCWQVRKKLTGKKTVDICDSVILVWKLD